MAKKEKENPGRLNKRRRQKRLRKKLNNKLLKLLSKLKSKRLLLPKEKVEEEEEDKVNNDLFSSITLNFLFTTSISNIEKIVTIRYSKFIILE